MDAGYSSSSKEYLTLLRLRCSLGDKALECILLLLELGADSQLPDEVGWTPLNFEAVHNHRKVVTFLLENTRPMKHTIF